jgi:uncharacterized protein YbcI
MMMSSMKTPQKKIMIEQNRKKLIESQSTSKKDELESVRLTKNQATFQQLRVSLTSANESYIKSFLGRGGLQTMLDIISETISKEKF